jgi:hypothetical protein
MTWDSAVIICLIVLVVIGYSRDTWNFRTEWDYGLVYLMVSNSLFLLTWPKTPLSIIVKRRGKTPLPHVSISMAKTSRFWPVSMSYFCAYLGYTRVSPATNMRLSAQTSVFSARSPHTSELRRIWLLRGLQWFRKASRICSCRKQGQSAWSSGHRAVLP